MVITRLFHGQEKNFLHWFPEVASGQNIFITLYKKLLISNPLSQTYSQYLHLLFSLGWWVKLLIIFGWFKFSLIQPEHWGSNKRLVARYWNLGGESWCYCNTLQYVVLRFSQSEFMWLAWTVSQQWAHRNVKSVEMHCLIPNILIKACRASHWTIVQTEEGREGERAWNSEQYSVCPVLVIKLVLCGDHFVLRQKCKVYSQTYIQQVYNLLWPLKWISFYLQTLMKLWFFPLTLFHLNHFSRTIINKRLWNFWEKKLRTVPLTNEKLKSYVIKYTIVHFNTLGFCCHSLSWSGMTNR